MSRESNVEALENDSGYVWCAGRCKKKGENMLIH